MKKHDQEERQFKTIQEETDSSAVLNDVVNSEFEQYPGQNESLHKGVESGKCGFTTLRIL